MFKRKTVAASFLCLPVYHLSLPQELDSTHTVGTFCTYFPVYVLRAKAALVITTVQVLKTQNISFDCFRNQITSLCLHAFVLVRARQKYNFKVNVKKNDLNL